MFHPVSVFIGLRYLRGRSGDRFSRFISYMSTAGITIGVLSLVTVLSVMNGFEAQLKDRILGVLPQAVISTTNGQITPSEDERNYVASLPHVTQVTPVVRGEAIIQSAKGLSAGMLVGIDPNEYDPIAYELISGNVRQLKAGEYGIFLGSKLARELSVRYGDTVRIMVTNASQYTPLGRIPSQRNFKIVGVFNTGSDVDGQLMIANIQDTARLMKLEKGNITGWRLFFDDPFQVTELAKLPLDHNMAWSDWRDQRGELFQAVKMEKNMMGLMLGLIVAIAAFNIISALIMVVMEKQAEVAILKTQGMTSNQVLSIFMVQGASSGVIGAIVGGTLGALFASNINVILSTLGLSLFTVGGSLPAHVEPLQVCVVIILAILLSLLATVFPSYRAAVVQPAEALRYE
ncbi:lipoprotein-releasing ABC transporter permease subunit LolC [Aliivibrio sifiae]|uniref:Transporter n=1 Tax=Aliivibrio sifiae TaxID=566293 RepID=A0A2S7X7F3_9GAMM|nr:lipoprotein-releasing ABC transporter permease subunit LolC [Aliivibrio sifiae]PQJ87298.1 transporter [Aliivibrio sifiae]GLR76174.1 transporter [Aliivibrio sifiae]